MLLDEKVTTVVLDLGALYSMKKYHSRRDFALGFSLETDRGKKAK
jgi:hypothetical protein